MQILCVKTDLLLVNTNLLSKHTQIIKNGGSEFPLTLTATVKLTGEPLSAEVTDPTFFMPFFVTIPAGFWYLITAV